ncbi:DUF4214 domain-containing protein [Aquihabitans sp. McL0605]|uniref:DUF4214 domain-containing protein n=1 Tax=Aquihabitans sp. McL0605 TaxID=3415671 RepID=UPI003CF1A333
MHTNRAPRALRAAGILTLAALTAPLLASSPAGATSNTKPLTGLISAAPNGKSGAGTSTESDVNTNGRFVAFTSTATDLVPGDTNGAADVFVRDTLTETTTRVSVAGTSTQADGKSDQPSISFDGRFVAFRSDASNLVAGDSNGLGDVFVRDLKNHTTTRVDVASGTKAQATGGASAHPVVSSDGLLIAFESTATNLFPGDTNNKKDVFVRDQDANTTEIASVASNEALLVDGAGTPSMSANGRYVVFTSMTNQVGTFADSYPDVFLRDRAAGTTERVSLSSDSSHPNGISDDATVSDDGRYVAFQSTATDLTMYQDNNAQADVFVRDRNTAATDLASRSTTGIPGSMSGSAPAISANGSKVVFASASPNIVSGDTNASTDVFSWDRATGVPTRVSVSTTGTQLPQASSMAAVSADGQSVTFAGFSTNGYAGDANSLFDVYERSAIQLGPWSDTGPFLQRTAKDFTGAALSSAALAAANDKLLHGTTSTSSIINGYAHGTWDDQRGPVMRLYWAFFKRMPDLNGLDYWTNKLGHGTTLKQIANSFAKSSEFKTNFGTGSDTAFVTLVYTNVLERQPDAPGLAHWVGQLAKGVTRGEMMVGFSESSEGIRKMRGEVDTVLVILGMLGRLPTSGEFVGYTNALELSGGQPTEVLIVNLLVGGEYSSVVH